MNAARECDCPEWVVACVHHVDGKRTRIIDWARVPVGVNPHDGFVAGRRFATYDDAVSALWAGELDRQRGE